MILLGSLYKLCAAFLCAYKRYLIIPPTGYCFLLPFTCAIGFPIRPVCFTTFCFGVSGYHGTVCHCESTSWFFNSNSCQNCIPQKPSMRHDLESLVSTEEFRLIGPLSKLISRLLAPPSVEPSKSRVRETWELLKQANATFVDIASNLQCAWTLDMIAEIGDENRIGQQIV